MLFIIEVLNSSHSTSMLNSMVNVKQARHDDEMKLMERKIQLLQTDLDQLTEFKQKVESSLHVGTMSPSELLMAL